MPPLYLTHLSDSGISVSVGKQDNGVLTLYFNNFSEPSVSH